ncbi:hypothetical protein A9Q02_19260 [Candidatus Chloroploca asiatica]|uniref:Uncharacterized protein n=2 Tax=Candidatus Chloroploca asiatica TaxID=1506545 RepID=A0A2H3KPP1_9CHLR|nr:hypothetical protein A9Q02_19260 [Candidatus Chloroploca asiatica]
MELHAHAPRRAFCQPEQPVPLAVQAGNVGRLHLAFEGPLCAPITRIRPDRRRQRLGDAGQSRPSSAESGHEGGLRSPRAAPLTATEEDATALSLPRDRPCPRTMGVV